MSIGISADWNIDVKAADTSGLEAYLAAGGRRARQAILDAIGESAARIYQRTVDLCPKDTFYMSEHVRTDFSAGGFIAENGWDARDFIGTQDAHGKPRAFYPFYVEFGTRHMRARPSLSIAFAEEAPRFTRSLERAVRQVVDT
jgi:hypothetical protein